MIIVCTHKSPVILERFLKSFREFSREDHQILVVETSDSQESKEIANYYLGHFVNTFLGYEIGAFRTGIDLFPNEEEYFCFQDSLEAVNFEWETMFRKPSKGKKMVGLCSYPLREDPCPNCGKDVFESIFQKPFPVSQAYGVLTNNFYLTKKAKDSIVEFGIHKLEAFNKNDTYATERVLGAIAYYSCGYSSTEEEVGEWIWDSTHFRKNTGFTKFLYKHILSRQ